MWSYWVKSRHCGSLSRGQVGASTAPCPSSTPIFAGCVSAQDAQTRMSVTILLAAAGKRLRLRAVVRVRAGACATPPRDRAPGWALPALLGQQGYRKNDHGALG